MPPAPKVDRGILIFDVASSCKEELLQSFLKFYTYKNISGTSSLYGIMLVNTEKTSNDGDIPNIVTFEEVTMMKLINAIRDSKGVKTGNWLRAVLLAVQHFAGEMPKGTITKQIVVYTTLEEDLNADKSVVNEIVTGLNEYNIFLYIIGPNITFPSNVRNMNDVRMHMMKLSVENANESLATALKIAHLTENTVICNADVGLDLLLSFKRFGGSQPWKVPLTFKSGEKVWLTLPVMTCKILQRDSKLRLHNTDIHKAATYVLAEDGSEVDPNDIVSGVLRHERLVNIPDEAMFKEQTERHFEVVCITKSENVPEAYITGDVTYSTIAEDDKQDSFLYLLRTLAEQDKYIIAERVYSANNAPIYVVLIPKPDNQPPCFYVRQIPYADDVNTKVTTEVPSPSGKTECDDITDFCSLISTETGKNGLIPPLCPQLRLSPYAHNLIVAHLNKKFSLSLARREAQLTESPEVESLLARLKSKWVNGIEEGEEDKNA